MSLIWRQLCTLHARSKSLPTLSIRDSKVLCKVSQVVFRGNDGGAACAMTGKQLHFLLLKAHFGRIVLSCALHRCILISPLTTQYPLQHILCQERRPYVAPRIDAHTKYAHVQMPSKDPHSSESLNNSSHECVNLLCKPHVYARLQARRCRRMLARRPGHSCILEWLTPIPLACRMLQLFLLLAQPPHCSHCKQSTTAAGQSRLGLQSPAAAKL
jgi:hypothetical protein